MNQKSFQDLLSRYFNTGVLSARDKVLSALHPAWPIYQNAGLIKNSFENLPYIKNEGPVHTYKIEKYSGTDETANQISEYLIEHLTGDLAGAVVHGSIATGEKINYSDFDGLVILKNSVFANKSNIRRVAVHLSKSYSLMIKGDSLQHHGWFILTETDINNWPSSYFPPVILNYSRSLLKEDLSLNLRYFDDAAAARENLVRMAAAIHKTLSSGSFPANAYQLKSLLSEFMLLPTLFLQALNGKGIYKKHSFTEALKYVDPSLWQSMDIISSIRQSWELNRGVSLQETPVLVTPALKKKQISSSAAIPHNIQSILNHQLRKDMLQLADFFVKATQ